MTRCRMAGDHCHNHIKFFDTITHGSSPPNVSESTYPTRHLLLSYTEAERGAFVELFQNISYLSRELTQEDVLQRHSVSGFLRK